MPHLNWEFLDDVLGASYLSMKNYGFPYNYFGELDIFNIQDHNSLDLSKFCVNLTSYRIVKFGTSMFWPLTCRLEAPSQNSPYIIKM